jgi:hypothetical protein
MKMLQRKHTDFRSYVVSELRVSVVHNYESGQIREITPKCGRSQNDHSWGKHRVSNPWVSTASYRKYLDTARSLETALYIVTF